MVESECGGTSLHRRNFFARCRDVLGKGPPVYKKHTSNFHKNYNFPYPRTWTIEMNIVLFIKKKLLTGKNMRLSIPSHVLQC